MRRGLTNYLSYTMVDLLTWQGSIPFTSILSMIKHLRKYWGLNQHIPHTYALAVAPYASLWPRPPGPPRHSVDLLHEPKSGQEAG
jgi:hypothetical protein